MLSARMKSVGTHPISICEFVRGQYGLEILSVDVEAVNANIDTDASLQGTEQLEGEARSAMRGLTFLPSSRNYRRSESVGSHRQERSWRISLFMAM
jgi:hypothetical protein